MKPLSMYLASSWSRRSELVRYAYELRYHLNVDVTSRWLSEDSQPSNLIPTKARLPQAAIEDLEDVRRASMYVRWADPAYFLNRQTVPRHLLSASRFVEQGYATALGKRVYIVGGLDDSGKTQPVFDELQNITHVKDFAEFVQYLTLVEAAA